MYLKSLSMSQSRFNEPQRMSMAYWKLTRTLLNKDFCLKISLFIVRLEKKLTNKISWNLWRRIRRGNIELSLSLRLFSTQLYSLIFLFLLFLLLRLHFVRLRFPDPDNLAEPNPVGWRRILRRSFLFSLLTAEECCCIPTDERTCRDRGYKLIHRRIAESSNNTTDIDRSNCRGYIWTFASQRVDDDRNRASETRLRTERKKREQSVSFE